MLTLPSGMYILCLVFGASFIIVVLAIVDGSVFEFGANIIKNIIVGGVLGGGIAITLIDLRALSTVIEWLPK